MFQLLAIDKILVVCGDPVMIDTSRMNEFYEFFSKTILERKYIEIHGVINVPNTIEIGPYTKESDYSYPWKVSKDIFKQMHIIVDNYNKERRSKMKLYFHLQNGDNLREWVKHEFDKSYNIDFKECNSFYIGDGEYYNVGFHDCLAGKKIAMQKSKFPKWVTGDLKFFMQGYGTIDGRIFEQ